MGENPRREGRPGRPQSPVGSAHRGSHWVLGGLSGKHGGVFPENTEAFLTVHTGNALNLHTVGFSACQTAPHTTRQHTTTASHNTLEGTRRTFMVHALPHTHAQHHTQTHTAHKRTPHTPHTTHRHTDTRHTHHAHNTSRCLVGTVAVAGYSPGSRIHLWFPHRG